MTRLTKETAFIEMSHNAINPRMSIAIIAMVSTTIKAEMTSNPSITKVTTKMVAMQMHRFLMVSFTMVRNCS